MPAALGESSPPLSLLPLSTGRLSAVEGGTLRPIDHGERLASEDGARPKWRPSGWSPGGPIRRFADPLQVAGDAAVIDHERQERHPPLALWTLENIQPEGAAQQERPRPVAASPLRPSRLRRFGRWGGRRRDSRPQLARGGQHARVLERFYFSTTSTMVAHMTSNVSLPDPSARCLPIAIG